MSGVLHAAGPERAASMHLVVAVDCRDPYRRSAELDHALLFNACSRANVRPFSGLVLAVRQDREVRPATLNLDLGSAQRGLDFTALVVVPFLD